MKKGDRIETPRFLSVEIQKVFRSAKNATKAGYTEPTHYNDHLGFKVYGKHTGPNLMQFAGVRPAVIHNPRT